MKTFEVAGRVVRGQFVQGSGGKTLVVFVHGWNQSGASFRSASAETQRLDDGADQFIAELKTGFLSFEKPERLAERLAADIDALDRTKGYARIVLVGHSCGALVARAAWLLAAGAGEDGVVGDPLHAWASKIERIVLMAAINRGWSDNVAMGPGLKIGFGTLAVWEFFLYGLLQRWLGTACYLLEMRRGAPFVTGVRLRWMAMARAGRVPLTVQVLGTIDDVVSPKDNVDLIAAQDFIYLEAPASGHGTMLDLDTPGLGPPRAKVFGQALKAGRATLRKVSLANMVADNLSDGLDDFDEEVSDAAGKRAKVQRVVFVIHGIRDYGFWTKKVAGRAKKLAGGATVCRTVTSSYGFFPMGPFVFKALRRRRVEWLMDQYVRAKALYPNAEFSYMGHSNGTALLASAMTLCRAIRFDRVVFAGSVVRRDYDWKTLKTRQQIGQVMNYVATDDAVVACFPKFLQRIPGADLGSAGFDGFKIRKAENPEYLQEVRYVRGGHGAALRETLWGQAARFLLGEKPGDTDDATDLGARGWWSALANGLGSWTAMPFIVTVIVALGLLILLFPQVLDLLPRVFGPTGEKISAPLLPFAQSWIIALAFLAYVWTVKAVLTRL